MARHDPDGDPVAAGAVEDEAALEGDVAVGRSAGGRHGDHRGVLELVGLAHRPVQQLDLDVVG